MVRSRSAAATEARLSSRSRAANAVSKSRFRALGVDPPAGLAQPVKGAVVGQLVGARRGVDRDDPQPPDLAFFAGAVGVGVLRRPLARFLRRLPHLAAPAEVALGELHHLLL